MHNGRITPRNRLTSRNGHTDGYNNVNYQSSGNHGGAIPKHFRDQENQQERYDAAYGIRTGTPIQFIDKTDNQKIDTRTMGIDIRIICMDFRTSDVDMNTMTTRIFANNHMEFTAQKYIDTFAHLQDNQRSNNINYTKEQMI